MAYARHAFGLPHARGGVSILRYRAHGGFKSSPRSWGCFQLYVIKDTEVTVFPTLVGVFPDLVTGVFSGIGLPHARGGVSAYRH